MKKFKIIVVFISILIAFGFTLKQDTALSFIDKSGTSFCSDTSRLASSYL